MGKTPKPRQTGVEPGAGTRAPGSDRPALREYRAGPGTAAPVPRLRNQHSPHVPPVPPPLRPRIPEPRSATQLCEWGKETSSSPRHSAAGEAWEGGHPPGAPGSTPPAANLLQSWLEVAAVRWGRTTRVLSAPGGGRPLCREPHWARTSAWRRRPSKPRRVQPGPRAQRPAVCIPPPAATPACAGSRFSSPETPGFGARSSRTAPPLVRSARGLPRSEPGVRRGERPRGARSSAGGPVWGTVLEFRAGCCACYCCAEFYWMLPARKGETFAYPRPPPKKTDSKRGRRSHLRRKGHLPTQPPPRISSDFSQSPGNPRIGI